MRSKRMACDSRLRRSAIWPLLLLGLLLPAAGCRKSAPPPPDPATAVEVEIVAAATMDEISAVSGVLSAWRAVDVVAEVNGRVLRIHRDVGDRVRGGERLAALDPAVHAAVLEQAAAALLAARARRDLAREDYLRDSTLHAQGDIAAAPFEGSQAAWRAARAEADAAEAARELAAIDLARAEVRAPFSGTLSRRYVDAGTYATLGLPLFRLVEIDSLRLVLALAQQDLARLEIGADVTVTAEALPEQIFSARVRSVSPEADAATRTFPVEVVLANPGPLRDGLVVRADLCLARHEHAIAVPREAVLRRGGADYVFVIEDSTAHQRAVGLGPAIGDRRVIERGLTAGERLVVRGMQNLREGARVSVAGEDA